VRSSKSSKLLPDALLLGYRNGFFPMADSSTDQIVWHRPDPRAIIPLNTVRIPRSLRQAVRKGTFTITFNNCFEEVIKQCSLRADTWINDDIVHSYTELHTMGFAHSVEAWHDDELVGGLYGVSISGAFFGESMFSRKSDASKVAFVHLVEHLRMRNFQLLDTQYINDFTAQLGAIEIPDSVYQVLLSDALSAPVEFLGA